MKIHFIYSILLLSIKVYSQDYYTIIGKDSLVINDDLYKVQIKNDTSDTRFLYIYRNDNVVLTKKDYSPSDSNFIDVNNDGFEDIIFTFPSNVPGLNDLFVFDKENKSFKEVLGFRKLPDSKRLLKTKYFYSYHRSGCADMNWDSDLFYVKGENIFKVATMHVVGCEDEYNEMSVFKFLKNEKKLIEKIDSNSVYNENSFDFIEEYWSKNYKKIIKKKCIPRSPARPSISK